jgi:hypothetical protein
MGLETIGTGLKTRLETISGLRVFAPNEIPETIPEFPAGVIFPGEVKYHRSYDNAYEASFRLRLLIEKQDLPTSMAKMIDYTETTGTYSVKAAIEGDRSLGGVAKDVIVKSSSEIGSIDIGGINYLSTDFEITVIGGY